MRFAIFGGTGRIGSLLRALSDGHAVSAFARDSGRLTVRHDQLTVVEGALDDGQAVAATIAGSDAVLCCLSAGNDALARFDAAALPLMQRLGPRRIVSMVGASVRRPGDPDTMQLHFMSFMMRLVPGHLLADAEAHADRLAASGLDWTLVRSANHVDAAAPAAVHAEASFAMRLAARISRADLAAFMLDAAVTGQFIGQAPMVENFWPA